MNGVIRDISHLFDSRKYIGYCLSDANNSSGRELTVKSTLAPVLAHDDGLHLGSSKGRHLIFKVTGEETGGALDYFLVGVAPHNGPPLHVHHEQDETIFVLAGQFRVQLGDDLFELGRGDFAFLPKGVPHAFINLTDEPAELVVTYTPAGGVAFFQELGPASRDGAPDPAEIAAIFERHNMSVLGPPLTIA
jgi:quercetin dioxygenase-like cupin family protein